MASWGHVEVGHVSHVLPDGRTLLDDVSFRVGEGNTAALVGPNGAGKTTLLRMVAGDLQPQSGTVATSGGLGVMRQFIGSKLDLTPMVRDLLLSVAAPRIREAAARLDAAELAMMERDDERTQLRYADALAEWGEAGGYEAEVHWDACTVSAFGIPYDQCRWRDVSTLSGGEQKRLVLESLLRGPDGVLLLDEPDNYLDVPGKRWLEQQLATTRQDGSAGQPRPGTPGRLRAAHRDGGGPARLGPRRRLRRLRPGPRWTGSAGWKSGAGAGMRSTTSSRSWSAPTGRRPPTTRTWPPGFRPR